ncbi:4-hydroxy-tetrahydrodipicolinate reductase [Odoribacter sp. OttesenSCG-928-G04]|nr:4-hydroxy-tetrahydrodipicolinate reductase [Odoribacter sp. OttesenSCG-928-G04]MDL2330601.1 4-hydroxy-tetrahydrodipicolinate reductase [Odoribacter sp. OttesenSCG-928-A06]
MNIALLGYGRMGKAIEKVAVRRGHTVVLKVEEENRDKVTDEQLKMCDVAIDFSIPTVAPGNYRWCFDNGIPVVSGTTGWLKEWDEIIRYCNDKKGGFFYASNFSIGANILFHMNKELARIMNRFKDYRASVEEVHHIHKLDAPSGTAITLAEGIMSNNDAYNKWELSDNAELGEGILPIKSVREGEVPGIHTIIYQSEIDQVTIRHEAFSRDGLAMGAMLAAEFLQGKSGVFGMDALMGEEK